MRSGSVTLTLVIQPPRHSRPATLAQLATPAQPADHPGTASTDSYPGTAGRSPRHSRPTTLALPATLAQLATASHPGTASHNAS